MADHEGVVRVWDGSVMHSKDLSARGHAIVEWDPNGKYLLVGAMESGLVMKLHPKSLCELQRIKLPVGADSLPVGVDSMAFNSSGSSLAIGCEEGLLFLEPHTLQVVRTLDDVPGVESVAAAFSPVGELLAVSSVGPHKNYLEIRDARTLALICKTDNVSPLGWQGYLCLRFVPYSQQQIHLAIAGREIPDGGIGLYSSSLEFLGSIDLGQHIGYFAFAGSFNDLAQLHSFTETAMTEVETKV